MPDSPMFATAGAQRSIGRIGLTVRRRAEVTVLDRLHQSGPLRLRIIRPEARYETTAILLNTAGGIAGGDRHDIALTACEATTLTLSTQGAERVYRAGPSDPPARLTTHLTIADAARIEYLPQETILFDQAALDRHLRIDLTGSAHYLGIDSLIFGRAAMGETIRNLDLTDTISLYRDGTLTFRDAIKPPRNFPAAKGSRAMFGNAAGIATILLASPDAATQLDAVRAALGAANAGASAWNGLLLVRILAQTAEALRSACLGVLGVLRKGRAMPRVWAC